MKIKVVVHEAEEGGYWAEVPAFPGSVTQGETMDELMENVRDVIELYLSVEPLPAMPTEHDRVLEIAL